jgi:hypothetical protein
MTITTSARPIEHSLDERSPRRTGKLAGSFGGPAELRATIAWSAIPLLVSGAMYLAALALTRESAAYSALANSLALAAQTMLRLGEVFFILGLWKFAVCFACTRENQASPLRQSALLRALTAAIVISALFALAIMLLAPIAASLSHAAASAMAA